MNALKELSKGEIKMDELKELEAKYKELGEEIEKLKSEKSKPKFWKPEDGKPGWYFGTLGEVHGSTDWKDKETAFNNAYPTKEEAIKARDLHECEMRLKEAIFNLNGGEVGKFVIGQDNFCVDLFTGILDASNQVSLKTHPNWFYLKNSEDIKKLIASHKDDLLMWLRR